MQQVRHGGILVHGGDVSAHSAGEGQGSSFVLALPRI
jgi:signal transduction histidine kinase